MKGRIPYGVDQSAGYPPCRSRQRRRGAGRPPRGRERRPPPQRHALRRKARHAPGFL